MDYAICYGIELQQCRLPVVRDIGSPAVTRMTQVHLNLNVDHFSDVLSVSPGLHFQIRTYLSSPHFKDTSVSHRIISDR
jgi:hypothetical protein